MSSREGVRVSAGSGWAVFPHPAEDFVVPVTAVGGFQYPVAFIREIDEFAGDTQPLQCCEHLLSFTDRDAEVEVVVDDQHGCFEVGGEAVRRMLFVGRAIGAHGGPPCSCSSNHSSSVVAYMLSKL